MHGDNEITMTSRFKIRARIGFELGEAILEQVDVQHGVEFVRRFM
jgi:hypothetical protein